MLENSFSNFLKTMIVEKSQTSHACGWNDTNMRLIKSSVSGYTQVESIITTSMRN